MIQAIWQDLRYTVRTIRNRPGFAAVAVGTLALGIAANTTVFSWVNTVLLHPLPGVSAPDEIVALEGIGPTGNRLGQFPHPDFRDYQRQMTLASGVLATHLGFFTVGPPDSPRRVMGQTVSANYFAVLGAKPALGRFFTPEEDVDTRGAHPYAVISHRLWDSYFRRDPGVAGKKLQINGRSYTVLGVAQPEFSGTFVGVAFDVWIPLSMIMDAGLLNTWAAADRHARFLDVYARLKPGVRMEQARDEVKRLASQIAATYPDTHRGVGATVVPVQQSRIGLQSTLGDPLKLLMAVCALVLLIACANVTNLLTARSIGRQREFAIRAALGARRWELTRQLLTEALTLAGAGALAGVALAQWMAESLIYVLPSFDQPVRNAVTPLLALKPDAGVLAFTVLITVGAALFATLAPAFYTGRLDVNESLKEGGRSGMAGGRTHRVRAALVAGEVALAAVALIGAGLAIRQFRELSQKKLGFEPANVLVAHLYLSTNGYKLDAEKTFARSLQARLEAAAGIEGVSRGNAAPLSLYANGMERVVKTDGEGSQSGALRINAMTAGPGYFRTMKIPLLEGRDFTEADDLKRERVVVVNQTMARQFFGAGSPLGRKLQVSGAIATVVGVAMDSKYVRPGEGPTPFLYGSFGQMFWSGHEHFFFVRARNLDLARAVFRREAAALDPNRGLYELSTMEEYTEAGLLGERVAASLLSALGALALALAAVGLYSVMAYIVNEQRQEIGIRLALGAGRGQVLGMVLRRGLAMTGMGLGAGALAAVAAARSLGGALDTPLRAMGPEVFLGAGLVLAAATLAACAAPAWRAARVDPMRALRSE